MAHPLGGAAVAHISEAFTWSPRGTCSPIHVHVLHQNEIYEHMDEIKKNFQTLESVSAGKSPSEEACLSLNVERVTRPLGSWCLGT